MRNNKLIGKIFGIALAVVLVLSLASTILLASKFTKVAAAQSITVTVPSTQPWTDTGLTVSPGDADATVNGVIVDPGGPEYPLSISVVYGLNISSTEGGSVTTPGEGVYPCRPGSVVNLVASPDAGYEFVNWTGDVDTIADVYDASTNITMEDWYSITANFEAEEVPPIEPPVQYDLTISCMTGGSVETPGFGQFTYEAGTTISLVVSSDYRYEFVCWSGDVGTIANVNAAYTTIIMNGDYSITANFEEKEPRPVSTDGCFIASAAYGTPMADEIQILREFRDKYLLTNPIGQAFVDLYYKVSPPIAEFITEHPSLKPMVRTGLLPIVAISTVVVNTTVGEKMVIVGLLVFVSAIVAIWVIGRRRRNLEYS